MKLELDKSKFCVYFTLENIEIGMEMMRISSQNLTECSTGELYRFCLRLIFLIGLYHIVQADSQRWYNNKDGQPDKSGVVNVKTEIIC